jgi:CRP-like cAMP-binding protein
VVRSGDVGDGLYFVSRGSLVVEADEAGGELARLESGDYFGQLSLLLGERRTASVRAQTHCDLFFLAAREFDRLRSQYPEFRGALKTAASGRTDKLAELVLAGLIL